MPDTFCVDTESIRCGDLVVRPLKEIPKEAQAKSERIVAFVNLDCGSFYELKGSDELYELSEGSVAAVVHDAAILVSPDERAAIRVGAGIWLVSACY